MRRAVFAMITAGILTTGGYLYGQQQTQPYRPPQDPPNIKAGNDIGFRVEGTKGASVIGTLMVRTKNGEWVEAHFAGRTIPLDAK